MRKTSFQDSSATVCTCNSIRARDCQASCILRAAGACATLPLDQAAPVVISAIDSPAVNVLPEVVQACMKLYLKGGPGSELRKVLQFLPRMCDAAVALCAAAEGAFPAGDFPQQQYYVISIVTLTIANLALITLRQGVKTSCRNPIGASMPSRVNFASLIHAVLCGCVLLQKLKCVYTCICLPVSMSLCLCLCLCVCVRTCRPAPAVKVLGLRARCKQCCCEWQSDYIVQDMHMD